MQGWTRWAGWPRLVRCDRGTHNRGVFSSTLAKNGVVIRPAGLEAPERIGRVERRGDVLKKRMSKVIKDTHASGRESMDMMLSECLNAANEMTRRGGFEEEQSAAVWRSQTATIGGWAGTHQHLHYLWPLWHTCVPREKPTHPSPAFDRMLVAPGLSCQAPEHGGCLGLQACPVRPLSKICRGLS